MAATVTVNVRYFASVREALGAGETVEVPIGTTLAALRDTLAARSPAHARALSPERPLRMALNQEMCDDTTRIDADSVGDDGVEVAFFPPVTGG